MLRTSDLIPLEEPTMQIGFVGLGTMGGPMARRLAAQGHGVTGYDVDAVRGARAREGGVTLATAPAGAAESAEFVLSSLPDPAAVRRAYLGADGVLSTASGSHAHRPEHGGSRYLARVAAAAGRSADCSTRR
jgi:nucleoside-diphosphate-sugar epimerase